MKSHARLDGIEILRGFAATGVIFFHTWGLTQLQQQDPLIDRILSYAAVGVPLFFAISAFSLLYGYHNRIFDEFSLKRFYIRRFFRLAPLFYVLFVVYVIYAYLGWGRIYSWSEIFINLTFTYQLIPTQEESIVWAGWTLGIEWIFYFIFPLVVILSRSRLLIAAVFLILLTISVGFSPLTNKIIHVDPHANYMNFMKHAIFFMLGVLIFCFLPEIKKLKKYPWLSRLDVVIVPLIAYFFVKMHPKITKEVAMCISFAALLIWAIIGYSKIFNNFFTRLLGKTSYGLYLMNPLIIYGLDRIGAYRLIVDSLGSFRVAFVLCCLLSFVCVLLGAILVYYTIEQPGIRLGQKIIDRIEAKNRIIHNTNLTG